MKRQCKPLPAINYAEWLPFFAKPRTSHDGSHDIGDTLAEEGLVVRSERKCPDCGIVRVTKVLSEAGRAKLGEFIA